MHRLQILKDIAQTVKQKNVRTQARQEAIRRKKVQVAVDEGKLNFSIAAGRIFPVLIKEPSRTPLEIAVSLNLLPVKNRARVLEPSAQAAAAELGRAPDRGRHALGLRQVVEVQIVGGPVGSDRADHIDRRSMFKVN